MLTRFARAFIHSPGAVPGAAMPRAGGAPAIDGSRVTRSANPPSTQAAHEVTRTGQGKGGRPGLTVTVTSPKKKDRRSLDEKHADEQRARDREQDEEEQELESAASTSRFAHWADLTPAVAGTLATRTAKRYSPGAMGLAERRRDLARSGGCVAGMDTPEQVASAAAAAVAKTGPSKALTDADVPPAIALARRLGMIK